MDKIVAKYEQLESGKFGAVGTPAFNVKSVKLVSLFAHMSQLCQTLNLPMPAQLHRLLFFNYLDLNCTGRQSYSVEDKALFP